jgi:hypothetical protein
MKTALTACVVAGLVATALSQPTTTQEPAKQNGLSSRRDGRDETRRLRRRSWDDALAVGGAIFGGPVGALAGYAVGSALDFDNRRHHIHNHRYGFGNGINYGGHYPYSFGYGGYPGPYGGYMYAPY